MKPLCQRNLDTKGRLVRGVGALGLFAGAIWAFAATSSWLGWILAASGAFVLFEALRGWCVVRACGIKTRI